MKVLYIIGFGVATIGALLSSAALFVGGLILVFIVAFNDPNSKNA